MATKSKYLIRTSGKEDAGSIAFRMAIPRDLRGQFESSNGKPLFHVTIGLGTGDRRVAQAKAEVLAHEWKQKFERARRGYALTPEEIEAEAREVYIATLEEMEADAKVRKPSVKDQLEELTATLEIRFFSGDIHETTWQSDLENAQDFDFVGHQIAAVQRRKGVPIEQGTDTYKLLGRAIVRANIWAIEGRMKALQGQPSEPPVTFLGARGIDPLTLQPLQPASKPPRQHIKLRSGLSFAEVSERFLDELQRDPDSKLRETSLNHHKNAFRLFGDYINNAPLLAVDRKTAANFLDTIAKLNPKWGQSPKSKGLPLNALLAQFGRGEKQLSNAAINHYASSLKTLFDWARKRGDLEGDNPFAEQSRRASDPRKSGWVPYKIEELNRLFGSEMFTKTPAAQRLRPEQHSIETTMLWVPLISLYSGLRLEEACQLQTSDVRSDSDVWYFDATTEDEGEDQKLKTEAAHRRVPVHSELIRCGFLEYWKSLPVGLLWPGLKRGGPDNKLGGYFSKRFTAYRRTLGVNGARKSFHSLRKNFTTALDNAGVYQADAAMLLGHARGFTFDHYSGGKGLQTLQGIVERVEYPGLVLDHLHIAE